MFNVELGAIPTPPFSRHSLPSIWMWLSRGRVFFAAVRTVLSHRYSEGAKAIIQNLFSAHCDTDSVNGVIREYGTSPSPLNSVCWDLRSLIQGEVRWGWCFEAECWVTCLQPPPTPPFLDMFCQAFECGVQGGGCFFRLLAPCFPIVILKEPKRVFRIYF